jgi:lauroyl/myristoyl acyltransferase
MEFSHLENKWNRCVSLLPRPMRILLCLCIAAKEIVTGLTGWRLRTYVRMRRTVFQSRIQAVAGMSAYYFWRNYSILEYGTLSFGSASRIRELTSKVVVRNPENLQNALGLESPLVIMVTHIGNVFMPLLAECGTQYFRGKKVRCIAPGLSSQRKRFLENNIRDIGKIDFSFIDLNSLEIAMKVYRLLQEKTIIICTLDYAYDRARSESVKILGTNTVMPSGILQIALMTKAILLPVIVPYIRFTPTIIFDPAVCTDRLASGRKHAEEFSKKIAATITGQIERFPTQWMMWDMVMSTRKMRKKISGKRMIYEVQG